jgi:hypothetical protein
MARAIGGAVMMAGSTSTRTPEVDPSLERAQRRRPRRRRWLITIAVVAVVAAVAVTVVVRGPNPFARKHTSHSGAGSAGSVATSLATVTQRELSSQTQVNATLGYAGSYTVTYQGGGAPAGAGGGSSGTFTSLPTVGTLVRQGDVLYRVNNNPVVVLYGSTPAYRTLAEGADASDVTGPDVAELNADLVALGYVSKSDVDSAWDQFNWATKDGIEKLQEHYGLDQTGSLGLGSVVFLPSAVRVTSVSASVGGPAGGPVLTATSTGRQVSIHLDTSQQSYVKVGDKVTITLPNNQTTPGVVSSVGTVASSGSGSGSSGSSSSPTVTVLIRPSDPAATGTWDQAPVTVTITTATEHHAVVVPVTALLAQAGGGYAVEVVAADGTHRLVEVTLGVFDDADGLVQVTGSGLAVGQRVVVPTV